jgi:hypothetical protein
MGKEERFDGDTHEFPSAEGGEEEDATLVERLRRMNWPAVDPELRQRSWERFQQLVAGRREGSEDEPDDAEH